MVVGWAAVIGRPPTTARTLGGVTNPAPVGRAGFPVLGQGEHDGESTLHVAGAQTDHVSVLVYGLGMLVRGHGVQMTDQGQARSGVSVARDQSL